MLDRLQDGVVVQGDDPIHYIGDSALVTQQNFDLAAQHGIVLTSRLPRTVALADSIVLRAVYEPLPMEDLGSFGAQKGATRYEGCVVRDCTLFGRPVQLGVYRPTPANERTKRAVLRRREKFLKEARRAAAKLMASPFACEADARTAIERFENEHLSSVHADRLLSITSDVVTETVAAKRPRGRPRKDSEVPTLTQYRVVLEVEPNDENTEAAIRRESCFVLVHTGQEPISARELLGAYKGQSVVEKRFPFLKDPSWAEVFFLKTPRRIEALGYILLLALLLWSVWERRVRLNLQTSGAEVEDTTKRKTTKPTATVCRHILADLKVMRVRTGDAWTPWQLTAPLNVHQERVLKCSGPLPTVPRLTARNPPLLP
jgi:transposase